MSRHVDEGRNFCECCGHILRNGVVCDKHHAIVSRGAGGPDIKENMLAICRLCHSRIHNGMIPKLAVLALIACREGKTIDEVQQIVWETMRNASKAQRP